MFKISEFETARTKQTVTVGGWYELEDGRFGRFEWSAGRLSCREIVATAADITTAAERAERNARLEEAELAKRAEARRLADAEDTASRANLVALRFELVSKPSNSKGWARYAASIAGDGGARVVASRTGNEWVSASHAGSAPAGVELDVRLQVMLRIGRSKQEQISTETYRLVAAEGASTDLELRPGSQGLRVRVEGARLIGGGR